MENMFKKYLTCVLLLVAISGTKLFASGIQVLNTTVTTNADKKSAQVKFSLTWDHSWRLSDGPQNWDAAWVFIKYRTLPGDNWYHAFIRNDSTRMPSNASHNIGNSVAVVGGVNTTVGVGAFIYRKDPGNGTIQFVDCEIQWDFERNGLTGGEQVEVCVLATEMVYIPQGAFSLGDQTSQNHFRRNAAYWAGIPYPIGSEAAVNMSNSPYSSNSSGYTSTRDAVHSTGIATGGIADDWPTANANGQVVALPAGYPKGFAAFYCMKYEITQGEYVQFLNKNLVTVKNGGYYAVDTVPPTPTGRYSIRRKPGTGTLDFPAEYEFVNPSAAYLPCNFLGTKDIMAWLIWAGLRPMSEFEYEKICRGPAAIPGTVTLRPQYAFGSINLSPAAGFVNKGMANEAPSNLTGNAAVATADGTLTAAGGGLNTALDGPMRSGGFATPVSSREKAGATYYGVMEMSGNLWERAVTTGNAAGRAFLGSVAAHGNGSTGPGLNPDLPIGGGWPPVNAAGLGFRGGSYLDTHLRARISDRQFININNPARHISFGGRGVRTAL